MTLNDRPKMRLALSALLMGAFALGGCSSQIADLKSDEVQPGPKEAGTYTYLPVNDVPPARGEAVISPEQRAKIEAELKAARDRQAALAAGKDANTK